MAERPKTFHLPLQALAGLFIAIATCAYTACSNSESVGNINGSETSPIESAFNVHETADSTTPASEAQQDQPPSITKYIPLDDTEYPYAGIPRIVIETENRREIKDRETEIPAKLQIWGEKAPESEIMELTIRGRGNTSWDEMPKKSYKIEFIKKQAMLGMPKDRDWALIANYADKTLMKNFLAYHLAMDIGMSYAPRCKFIELFINKEYMGLYLLTETIKIAQNRINIPKGDFSYIIEFDNKVRESEQYFFSSTSIQRTPLRIHYPKNISNESRNKIIAHIHKFESFLLTAYQDSLNEIRRWIDIEEFAKHYWIQEITKNPDTIYPTSVYFTWVDDKPIQMGPVWDFDLAFGGHYKEDAAIYKGWRSKDYYWNEKLFANKMFEEKIHSFWFENETKFHQCFHTIDSLEKVIENAAANNFRKWNILRQNGIWISKPVENYNEAVLNLRHWYEKRVQWINENINFHDSI